MPFTRVAIVFKSYELEIGREFVGGLLKEFNGTTMASRQREIHFFYDRLSPADAILPYYSYSHRRYSPSIIYDVAWKDLGFLSKPQITAILINFFCINIHLYV